MMSKKIFKFFSSGLLAICTALAPANVKAELMINEIMQSNIDCIMDNFNEFPDSWVEIYNPDSKTVSFNGYSIGIDEDPTNAFALAPYYSILPHSYQVVHCNKIGNPHQWCSDFRLESGKGCNVYLFKDGKAVDSIVNLKKQPAPNIAYGRKNDGSDNWGYQQTPTPGKSNCGVTLKEVLPDPVFSHSGAVSPEPFELTISLPTSAPQNAIIRFTLDGSEPTAKSPTFSSPIRIDKSTVVRAKLFADDFLSPISVCQSYIFHPRTQSMTIISIVTDPEYLYGEKIGIFSDYKAPLHGDNPNYQTDIRRPANFEFFFENETNSGINQLGEMRIKGESSRAYPLKSLAIYANKRFGTKRFNYEVFPDLKPGLSDFKSLELRNGGSGDAHRIVMRDAVIQRLMGENTNVDWQSWRPSVVYLNGEYYGMLNIRERANEDNIYSNYDGLEDIDMIENWKTVKAGSIDSFIEFRDFYSSGNQPYEEFKKRMDIESFINHTIAYLFFVNIDYPNNNFIMWRPTASDGKWRFSLKDFDGGLGLTEPFDFPIFHWIYNPQSYPGKNWANTPESTLLLRTLLEFPEFKKEFIDRMTFYAGDFLTPNKIIHMLDSMADEIVGEVYASQEKNSPEWANFNNFLNAAKNWVPQRWEFMKTNIPEFFDLGNSVSLTLKDAAHQGITYSLNGIPLTSQDFNGYYYYGETLHVESSSPELIKGWKVKSIIDDSHSKSIAHYQPTLELTIPDYKAIEIYPIFSDSGVEGIDADYDNNIDFSMPFDVYTLSGYMIGNSIQNLDKGIYIIRQGNKSLKYRL